VRKRPCTRSPFGATNSPERGQVSVRHGDNEFTPLNSLGLDVHAQRQDVGGETIRPLLKSLPKPDADALRARLETLEAYR
jgi:hypothetical protein